MKINSFLTALLYHDIYNQILLSPAFFKEIYYERRVNNIYLDSFDYANYYANINGEQNRVKQRIRWYGDTFDAKTPILEYKIKHGELGIKAILRDAGFQTG